MPRSNPLRGASSSKSPRADCALRGPRRRPAPGQIGGASGGDRTGDLEEAWRGRGRHGEIWARGGDGGMEGEEIWARLDVDHGGEPSGERVGSDQRDGGVQRTPQAVSEPPVARAYLHHAQRRRRGGGTGVGLVRRRGGWGEQCWRVSVRARARVRVPWWREIGGDRACERSHPASLATSSEVTISYCGNPSGPSPRTKRAHRAQRSHAQRASAESSIGCSAPAPKSW